MNACKIGVMSDCFRLGPRDGIRKAAELGADGVQVWTVSGEMSPESMTAAKRKEFKAFLADTGVELASLCGDIGGYTDAASNPERVARQKLIVELAADLGTAVVTSHIGVVPADGKNPAFKTMLDACRQIAGHAASRGVTFAAETGPETAAVLKKFLDEVGPGKGLGVNLDPANLIMVAGDDPVAAVRTLKDYIVHTHAKDGFQLKPADPASGRGPDYKEVPLGKGKVDWNNYLKALDSIGFRGFLSIEREVGADPAKDIAEAITFLRQKLGRR